MRKNINATADDAYTAGAKHDSDPHPHTTTTDAANTTPAHTTAAGSSTATGHTPGEPVAERESTGIHPDARAAGETLAEGVGAAAGKVQNWMKK